MKDSANDITINYSKSPEVKELFSRKSVGDKCEMTVELIVKEIRPDEVIGSIKKITYEHEGEEETAEPDAAEPAMIKMDVGGEEMPLESAASY